MRAHLRPHELDHAHALGMIVNKDGEGLSFLQTCHLLNEKKCTIYNKSERPQVCERYRCKLLKRYLAGEMELDTALATIRSTGELLDELQQLMPYGKDQRITLRGIRLMAAYLSTLPEDKRQPHAAFLHTVTRYLRLITQEFVYFMDSNADAIANTEMASQQ